MYRQYFISLLIVTLILVTGGCNSKTSDQNTEKEAVPVQIQTVKLGTIEDVSRYFGTVQARESVKVYSTVPKRILVLYHDVGESVTAGTFLADVEREQILQAVRQAEAGLESAQAKFQNVDVELKRLKKLYREQAVSQSQLDALQTQWDGARSAVKQFRASLSAAQSQLAETHIKAPISGVIVNRLLETGDLASPQIPVFEIANMDTVKINVQIIERDLGKVHGGQPVRLKVATYPDSTFEGKIIRVNPTLNPMTRTADAEIEVANLQHLLKPGMFATVDVILNRKEQVPVIPKHTIIEKTMLASKEGDFSTGEVVVEKHVFLVKGNRAYWRTIETGIINHISVEVTDGLTPGDTIVSVGHHMLSDSSRIEIVSTGGIH